MSLAQRHSVTLAMAATIGTLTFSQGWIFDMKQWVYKVGRGDKLPDPIDPQTGDTRGTIYGPVQNSDGSITSYTSKYKHINAKTVAALVILWAILAGIADTQEFSDLGVALAWAIAVSVMLYWGADAASGIREVV